MGLYGGDRAQGPKVGRAIEPLLVFRVRSETVGTACMQDAEAHWKRRMVKPFYDRLVS